MAGSDDRSLDLRLAWGRPKPLPGNDPPDTAGDAEPERPDGASDAEPERPVARAADAGPDQPVARAEPERREVGPGREPGRPERAAGGGRKRRRRRGTGPVEVVRPGVGVPHEEPAVAEPVSDRAQEDVEPERPRGSSTEPPEVTNARAVAEAATVDERLQRLQLGIASGFDRLEEQADAHDADLEARLEKLEMRLEAAHAASIEAVGLLAGQVVARLEEQAAYLEAAIQSRHEDLVGHVELALETRHEGVLAKIDAVQVSMMEAMADVASGKLVERLLEGVVALGEVLDADLINLRRLLKERDQALQGNPPAG